MMSGKLYIKLIRYTGIRSHQSLLGWYLGKTINRLVFGLRICVRRKHKKTKQKSIAWWNHAFFCCCAQSRLRFVGWVQWELYNVKISSFNRKTSACECENKNAMQGTFPYLTMPTYNHRKSENFQIELCI